MYSYLLVAAGAALGGMGRYAVAIAVGRHWHNAFPLGTFLANLIGSTVMGLFIGMLARWLPSWQNEARLFIAVGMLGGFTTFSSFSLDTITLIERGDVAQAGLYVLLSVVVCLAGLYLGLLVTRGPA